jgi:very-short-patch-repair endonuclease
MRPEAGKAGEETTEEVIARVASASHGVVTRSDLLQAGLAAGQIKRRVARGALIIVHRGIYRVGHRAPNREAHYTAAVKACGDGAVLCGRAAAHLWNLFKGSPPQPEVLAPAKRLVRGVITHRAGAIDSRDITTARGVPVTTVSRTLVDLASSLPQPALARACHEAEVLHGTPPDQIEEVLARRPSSPGAGKLRAIIHGGIPVTLSTLEARFLRRLREAGLPLPETNRPAGGSRVDCRWPARRLTVELDSYRYHRSRHSWEKDRQREREARTRGDEFRRYTYRDVFEDPQFMLAELRKLLQPYQARRLGAPRRPKVGNPWPR